jgi:hypothetical protein
LADADGQMLFGIMIIDARQADVFDVVHTTGSPCRFTRGLNGWQKQRHQNADNRNDNEQFHECETRLRASCATPANMRSNKSWPAHVITFLYEKTTVKTTTVGRRARGNARTHANGELSLIVDAASGSVSPRSSTGG